MVCLSQLDLCPALYGSFRNGLVYGYIPGSALHAKDLHDDKIWRRVATLLAKWHRVDTVPGNQGGPKLFPTLRKWLLEIPNQFSSEEKQKQFSSKLSIQLLTEEVIV